MVSTVKMVVQRGLRKICYSDEKEKWFDEICYSDEQDKGVMNLVT
jgi:hypothetical protein